MAETPLKAEQQSSSSLKIYFRLLSYVKPYIGIFMLSILGFIIFASTQPMLAGILKYFVDGLSNPQAVLFPNVPYLRDLQLLQAVPSLLTYEASLRLDDRRRAELLAQLHGILGADDRADLEAALQRRPLVKNVMVLQTNGDLGAQAVILLNDRGHIKAQA